MYLSLAFCIFATSFVLVQCNNAHSREHGDYTVFKGTQCGVDRKGLIHAMRNAVCKPDYRHVPLKPKPFEEFHPSVVSVKRCDGNCPGHSCMPVDTRTIKIPVRLNTNHPTKNPDAMCVLVEVEEHTKCRCTCLHRESDCNDKQEYIKDKCACACKNAESNKKKCESKMGMVWDDEDCSCNCTEMSIECMPGRKWNREKCECVETSVKYWQH